jgi:hypothetical protein
MKQVIKHELLHVIGFAYGLRQHCLKHGLSFKSMFDKAEVFFNLKGSVYEEASADCGISILELQPEHLRKITSYGALIPAVSDNEHAAIDAIQKRSIDPLFYHEELSEEDQLVFTKSPLDLGTVLEGALVATEYMSLTGTKFHKFAKALEEANISHDLFPMNTLVHFDRLTNAIKALPENRNQLYTRAQNAKHQL